MQHNFSYSPKFLCSKFQQIQIVRLTERSNILNLNKNCWYVLRINLN